MDLEPSANHHLVHYPSKIRYSQIMYYLYKTITYLYYYRRGANHFLSSISRNSLYIS